MDLYTYHTTNVLDTLAETLRLGNCHVDVVVAVVSAVCAVYVALGLGWASVLLCFCFSLFLSILRDHVGHLHLERAFLMCSSTLRNR